MIFEPQRYNLVFWDAVYSMGVGFAVGLFRRVLSCFLYKRKTAVFIRDIMVCAVFSVLLFSYCISFANYKILRWYNVLFAVLGLAMFTPAFVHHSNRFTDRAFNKTNRMIVAQADVLKRKITARKAASQKEMVNFTQKSSNELLKDKEVMLYN